MVANQPLALSATGSVSPSFILEEVRSRLSPPPVPRPDDAVAADLADLVAHIQEEFRSQQRRRPPENKRDKSYPFKTIRDLSEHWLRSHRASDIKLAVMEAFKEYPEIYALSFFQDAVERFLGLGESVNETYADNPLDAAAIRIDGAMRSGKRPDFLDCRVLLWNRQRMEGYFAGRPANVRQTVLHYLNGISPRLYPGGPAKFAADAWQKRPLDQYQDFRDDPEIAALLANIAAGRFHAWKQDSKNLLEAKA
ncbi:MAG: hypothetical protein NTW87_19565 [Planctomycetota bacterium]|nr:hypothetical protein [Planctomycetota bacterium]